jgi:hypothetical protein
MFEQAGRVEVLLHVQSAAKRKQGSAMAERKDITGRDNFILVQALSFTIEAFSGLPIEFRPENNIADMKRILDELVKQDANLAQSQLLARRKLDQVLTHIRRPYSSRES